MSHGIKGTIPVSITELKPCGCFLSGGVNSHAVRDVVFQTSPLVVDDDIVRLDINLMIDQEYPGSNVPENFLIQMWKPIKYQDDPEPTHAYYASRIHNPGDGSMHTIEGHEPTCHDYQPPNAPTIPLDSHLLTIFRSTPGQVPDFDPDDFGREAPE